MAIVTPAQAIWELLMQPGFADERDRYRKKIQAERVRCTESDRA
jgi:hypothetical protein